MRIGWLRISLLYHDCGNIGAFVAFVQRNTELVDRCPFHWKMEGGDTYNGCIHYFTLFRVRLVIQTTRKQELFR